MLDLLANKWSALSIGALEEGPLRFGEIKARLQGVSPKVLSQTLKRLEGAGLLSGRSEHSALIQYCAQLNCVQYCSYERDRQDGVLFPLLGRTSNHAGLSHAA
ncbi:winged helix-turn-helix transcriptional regulator [Corynebacterium flavescens]|uniref:winged helix-turn-helix transcriptional regulator n=1 Tax=Corynebacterium flavescens TaxID=28028 RepID=UPI003FD2C15F